jgi:nicotinate-nucleotide adenylyltransferase
MAEGETPKRFGVLGGTFDPVHYGHLLIAEQAHEALGLDRVLFIPAAIPPHKQTDEVSSGRRRLEMVELAIAGNPYFEACDVELERRGVSYTVDTLQILHDRRPGAVWYLILGGDSALEFSTWRDPEQIAALARIVIVHRPGSTFDPSSLSPPLPAALLNRIEVLETPQYDFASTDIRRRAADGRTIRYLTPAAVEAYIAAHRLYTGGAD